MKAYVILSAALVSTLASCTSTDCLNSRRPPCGDPDLLTQPTARSVPVMNGTGTKATGSVDPETGANWYVYEADGAVFSGVDPEVYLHTQAPALVCVYMEAGFTGCPANADPATAPDGSQGCCQEGTNLHFQIQASYSGTTNVYMSVESMHTVACNACVDYELDYNW